MQDLELAIHHHQTLYEQVTQAYTEVSASQSKCECLLSDSTHKAEFRSLAFLNEVVFPFHSCNSFKDRVRPNPRLQYMTYQQFACKGRTKGQIWNHTEMKSRTSVGTPKKKHFTVCAELGTPFCHQHLYSFCFPSVDESWLQHRYANGSKDAKGLFLQCTKRDKILIATNAQKTASDRI